MIFDAQNGYLLIYMFDLKLCLHFKVGMNSTLEAFNVFLSRFKALHLIKYLSSGVGEWFSE